MERKEGTKAKAEMTFTGKSGTVISAGNVFLTEDGCEYIRTSPVKISMSDNRQGSTTASEAEEK